MRAPFAWLLGWVVVASSWARADTVVLRDGRTLAGTVEKETDTAVVVNVGGVQMSVPRARVKSIAKDEQSAQDSALARADALLRAKRYLAAVKAYEEALPAFPERARAGIEDAKKGEIEKREREYADLSLEEAETRLRKEIAEGSGDASFLTPQLARVLMRKAAAYREKTEHEAAEKTLQEAWDLCPETPGLASVYVRALKRAKGRENRIVEVLRAQAKNEPENMEAMEDLVGRIWKTYPWETLGYIYPDNALRSNATDEMKRLLPEVLLACFNTWPYPATAPFDKMSCYERYIAFKPDASPLPLLEYKVKNSPDSAVDVCNLAQYEVNRQKPERAIAVLCAFLRNHRDPDASRLLQQAAQMVEDRELNQAEKLLSEREIAKAQTVCENLIRLIGCSERALATLQRTLAVDPCSACGCRGSFPCPKCGGSGTVTVKQQQQIEESPLTPLPAGELQRLWQIARGGRKRHESVRRSLSMTGEVTADSGYSFSDGFIEHASGEGIKHPADVIRVWNKTPTESFDLICVVRRGGTPTRALQCTKCKGYNLVDNLSPGISCLICFAGPERKQVTVDVPVACPDCQGTGRGQTCATCQGAGLVQLAQPRRTTLSDQELVGAPLTDLPAGVYADKGVPGDGEARSLSSPPLSPSPSSTLPAPPKAPAIPSAP